ncbi:MAG: hypothetical protein LBB75_09060 [Oscillospiraceae bacterium]|jgi:hypothetical protein|nr:hypothetical protein [Oscillospiraceae bacterium]
MITSVLIQQLKQSNISKDGPKTGARVQEIWKAATAAQKQAVCELSGSAKATVYRIFKTGGISAKLAMALSQVLNLDPRYLTGEADDQGAYAEADVTKFLSRLGYDKLLNEQEKAARVAQRELARQKKEAPVTATAGAEEAPAAAAEEKPSAKEAPVKDIVTNEDILVLLQALEIRAKAGIPEAKQLLGQIKILLLGC